MSRAGTFDFSSFSALVFSESDFARNLLSDMCRAFRFKSVVSKADPSAAWDVFKSEPIDIVVGDIATDKGLDLLKSIRNVEISPNSLVPFIAAASTSSASYVRRARDSGATEFLRLPISSTTLIERIIHVVENPRVFVRAKDYLGPDRRRKQRPFQGPDRRQTPPAAADGTPVKAA